MLAPFGIYNLKALFIPAIRTQQDESMHTRYGITA